MHVLRFLLIGALVAGTARAADPAAQPKTVKMFNIGNSFSNNATRYLMDITKAAGHKLVLKAAVIGGSSMAVHWAKVEANEADPTDAKGLYAGNKSLKELLASDKWDIVTIQQASFISNDIKNYRPYAKQLKDYVAEHVPQAELVLHETWPYRSDDPRFTPKGTATPQTQKMMYEGLAAAYSEIAKELGLRIVPVGDAFYLADTDAKFGYKPDAKFDFKEAKSPALPDQSNSLHVGWRWTKSPAGDTKLTIDGHHASMAGEYLGACVFFEFLFNESVVGNKFIPQGLKPEHALFLQETAHKAVAKAREGKPKK